MLVAGLKGLKVIDVACGSGDAQTLAVTENGMQYSCCPGQVLRMRSAAFLEGVSFGVECTHMVAPLSIFKWCAPLGPWKRSRSYKTFNFCCPDC